MFIKNYRLFLENQKFAWIVPLYREDEYIRNIVNRFIADVPTDVSLANSIGLLDEHTQKEIVSLIKKYQDEGIQEKEPVVSASTDTESLNEAELTPGGKGAFTSFLKVMTALGQKDVIPDFSACPDDFLLFYVSSTIETSTVKGVVARYASLSRFTDEVDYTSNETVLYFGVRCDNNIEFGTMNENTKNVFGKFKINASVIRWITTLDLKSAFSLKKEIVNLTASDISTLCSIKRDMIEYNPGSHESKMDPTLTDKVISFGYQGLGKWDDAQLGPGEIDNIKSNFVSWVMSKKWSDKVLISVKAGSNWVYMHIKLK